MTMEGITSPVNKISLNFNCMDLASSVNNQGDRGPALSYWKPTAVYNSTNENPSLSRSNFLANLMHGHSDSSWSGSSLPEITEQRIFHVLFYYEQIRL